jgi:uncharacterized protein YukE
VVAAAAPLRRRGNYRLILVIGRLPSFAFVCYCPHDGLRVEKREEVVPVPAIRVLPSELEAAAGRLQASADQVRSVVGTLCPAAPGIGAALGDPRLAERFQAAWSRWASQLGAIADDLTSAAARLQVAAGEYRATDRTAIPPGPPAR